MSVLYVGQRVFCVSKGVFRVSVKVLVRVFCVSVAGTFE